METYTSVYVQICICGWSHVKASQVAQMVKNLPAMQETQEMWVRSLEEEMATHYSILDWEIPWRVDPDGLQSVGSQRDTTEHTCTHACISSVQSLSRVQLFGPHELQHARPPCPSPTPGVYSSSCPSSR